MSGLRYLRVLGLIAVAIICGLALQYIFDATGSGMSIYRRSGLGIIFLYLMTIGLVVAFMRYVSPVSAASFIGGYRGHGRTALTGFLTMFALGLLMVTGLFILLAITGNLDWHDRAARNLRSGFVSKMAIGVISAIALAITEEFIFRGFLLRYLRWNTTVPVTVAAVFASAFVFATAHHIDNPLLWLTAREFPLFVGLFILGVLLAVTYLVTGSLWCSIGLHAGLVVMGEVFLRRNIVAIDFSPWWLGGIDEIRMAPLVWLSFAVTTIIHYATRDQLRHRFGIEKPFVGTPLAARETGRPA